jgi:predicted transcriptional regulator
VKKSLDHDPVLAALRDAPVDDEPLSEEDVAALDEAWEDVRQGRLVPHQEIRRQVLGGD